MGDAIWTFMHLTRETPLEPILGLIGEARRLADTRPGGSVTALLTGEGVALEGQLTQLGAYGAERVIVVQSPELVHFHGELLAAALYGIVQAGVPRCLLLAHTSDTAELAGRLGALLHSAVITGAVDLRLNLDGGLRAVRPRANGYLFEELEVKPEAAPALVTLLPSIIGQAEVVGAASAQIQVIVPDIPAETLKTRIIETLEAEPGELDIEEADIVVAGGRGVGKGPAFEVLHELARLIGGSVGGTRPVIDWQTLPFERQIGQTGKTVTPRLLINCGISGANEYTAGMEQAQQVIAINTDPQARIFRFADLGLVGDLHAVLPALIERLKGIAARKTGT
jgi:electron transfer flavoprotein alpha subunit